MKTHLILSSVLLLMLFCFFSPSAAKMTSKSYIISETTLSSGGATTISPQANRNTTTMSQPTIIGASSGSQLQASAGFWYSLENIPRGDFNGDNATNLADLILTLQVSSGDFPERIFVEADLDGDGKIGGKDSLDLLQTILRTP